MFLENVKFALSSLVSSKARSFLTMLGIIIGVFSVVVLISIGEGIRGEFSSQIKSIGSNLIMVASGDMSFGGEQQRQDNVIYTQKQSSFSSSSMTSTMSNTLTQSDIEVLKSEVPAIKDIGGMALVATTPKYENKVIVGPMMLGLSPGAFNVYGASQEMFITTGSFFSEDNNQRQIVIGKVTKDGVFGKDTAEADVIGKKLTLFNEDFEIIGVYDQKESSTSSMTGETMSDAIVLPLSTAMELSEQKKFYRILINIDEADNVNSAKESIRQVLLKNHNNEKDFSIMTQQDILNVFDSFLSILTSAVSGIAAISLVVGGIGIMNIMLVAVSERTREIGIRKAIGASSFHILSQFLVESIILGLIGGGLGLALAYGVGSLIEKFAKIPTQITLEAAILAFGISFVVGVVFGLAPAIKASRKSPIEALRYE